MTVVAGESVSIHCSAKGLSPSISFRHSGAVIADFTGATKLIRSGDVLMNFSKVNTTVVRLVATIADMHVQDGGSYTCLAKSAASTESEDNATFYVSVEGKVPARLLFVQNHKLGIAWQR